VDDFIINFIHAYFSVMDPNDLLCMASKWQRGDVSRHTGGDLRAALGRIKTKTFVMPMSSDVVFPPADCQAEWRLIPDAEFRPIQTIDGDLALFGADPGAIAQLDKNLNELLAGKESVNEQSIQRSAACLAILSNKYLRRHRIGTSNSLVSVLMPITIAGKH